MSISNSRVTGHPMTRRKEQEELEKKREKKSRSDRKLSIAK